MAAVTSVVGCRHVGCSVTAAIGSTGTIVIALIPEVSTSFVDDVEKLSYHILFRYQPSNDKSITHTHCLCDASYPKTAPAPGNVTPAPICDDPN